ncbi:RNA polymerase sigma factor [Flammeovirgaceae bacterium SG7u.111]|nr:RNA polymerase sigma factor [Flammeovirgaceae bacterium SG7u.132]WPO34277.1 RNA polymerase sigma factor [Flammeovirgaceae bacterium SG7u.111]
MENGLTQKEITCIKACLKGKRTAQEELYKSYYGYGMSIAMRYAGNKEEAEEIFNDSFMKVFGKLKLYDLNKSFKGWVRRIIINTSIDYYRGKNQIEKGTICLEGASDITYSYDIISKLTAEQILTLLQKLPDKYRLTFNLYELEGYSHQEISEKMNIPVGTSRSNLTRAKNILREKVKELFTERYERTVRQEAGG